MNTGRGGWPSRLFERPARGATAGWWARLWLACLVVASAIQFTADAIIGVHSSWQELLIDGTIVAVVVAFVPRYRYRYRYGYRRRPGASA